MAIEKNAVLGTNSRTKTASLGCPLCGAKLDNNGSLPRCPVHGTAPFEHGSRIAKGGYPNRR